MRRWTVPAFKVCLEDGSRGAHLGGEPCSLPAQRFVGVHGVSKVRGTVYMEVAASAQCAACGISA